MIGLFALSVMTAHVVDGSSRCKVINNHTAICRSGPNEMIGNCTYGPDLPPDQCRMTLRPPFRPTARYQDFLSITLPVAKRLGLANALIECGVGSFATARYFSDKLYTDPYIQVARRALTEREQSEAEGRINQTVRDEEMRLIGGRNRSGCMTLARAQYLGTTGQ